MSDGSGAVSGDAGGEFDLVVLGAGSGGYACALRAAELGLSVALVEKDKVGGTCLHVGCIPTKALLHAAEVADSARDGEHVGVRTRLEGIDLPAVNAYAQRTVDKLYRGLTGLVRGRGITVVEGTGRLTGPREVTVDGATWTARRAVVLATGSRPRSLPSVEVDGERVLTSEQALRLEVVPASVIVLGGGVIGVEFASVWRSFGAEVTVLEALPHLVPAEDEHASKALERAFRKRGIRFHTGTRVESVKSGSSGVSVTVEDGTTHEADLLLVAVGRGPVSEGLGLEDVGVTTDRGWVPVDDRLQTSVPGVYAVGDLVPGLQLAHRGFAHGVFVAEEVAGLAPRAVPDHEVPRVTYSEPEVASVGLTEAQARAEHGDDAVRTVVYDLAGNGKSQILGTQGFVKLVRVVDGPVVGAHLVGSRVGEQIGEAQLLVGWEAHPEDVTPYLHAHPTQNEALGEAHLALAGKPLHAHG